MFGEESSTKYRTLTHVGKVGSFDRPTAHTTPGRALTHTASRSGHRASIQHDGYLDIDQNLPSLDLKGGSSRQKKTKHRRSRSDTMAIQSTQGKEPGLVDGRTKGGHFGLCFVKCALRGSSLMSSGQVLVVSLPSRMCS